IVKEYCDDAVRVADGDRDPPVAESNHTPRGLRKGTDNDDRRMRFLNRLRPGHHWREIHELAVIFGLRLCPDRLHRFDPLAHQLEAGREGGAVALDLLTVPAAADAKQKPPARYLVD